MTINEQLRLGRAKNAVLTYLEKNLFVPKIYIDADWDNTHIDVLALDRDGSGDVAAVLLLAMPALESPTSAAYLCTAVSPLLKKFEPIPAQFKYIATIDMSEEGGVALQSVPSWLLEDSYSPDGLGRVGYLSVDFVQGAEPRVVLLSKPERFRAKIAQLVHDYIEHHTADWEIRA